MEAEVLIVNSLGFCERCQHNIYEDKSHPSWLACYCEKPEIRKVASTPQPSSSYEDYC